MVYVIFVAVNIKAVVDDATEIRISLIYYMVSLFVPFALIMAVRNLKLLAPFSIIANCLTIVLFGVLFYYVLPNLPPIKELPIFGSYKSYPLYFGTTLFALESVGVVSIYLDLSHL